MGMVQQVLTGRMARTQGLPERTEQSVAPAAVAEPVGRAAHWLETVVKVVSVVKVVRAVTAVMAPAAHQVQTQHWAAARTVALVKMAAAAARGPRAASAGPVVSAADRKSVV